MVLFVVVLRFDHLIALLVLHLVMIVMMLVVGSLVLVLALAIAVLVRVARLVLACDVSPLANQARLLHSSLLHSKYLLKANALHLCVHRTKDEIAGASLQGLMGLLADQDLVWRALRAHS